MEKEKEVAEMSEEIAHAVEFYVNHLATLPKPPTPTEKEKEKESKEKEPSNPLTELDSATLETFREELSKLLHEKYSGHWYPTDKLRGSGFRSISYDTRMDAVFLKAAEKAMIDRLPERFENARYYIVFVNPGEVKLKNTRLHTSEAKYLWRLGGIIDEEESIPDLKTDSKLKDSSLSSLSSLSPTSSPSSSDESPRYSSPSRGSTRTTEIKVDRSTPSSTTTTPPFVSHIHSQGPRKLSPARFSTSESSLSSTSQPRSPSPPPLSLDQYGQQTPSPFPHSHSHSQTFHSSNSFSRMTPHSLSEPYVHGTIPYNLPRRNGGNGGPTFSTYTPTKYTTFAPRSRTPSPPLLVGTTPVPTPQIGGFFPRSHTTPTRPPSSIMHHPTNHELPRPHLHHPPHDYTRFLPRYRSMVHTRS